MSTVPFYDIRARYFTRNGNPLSNGRVLFYNNLTTTPKEVFTDEGVSLGTDVDLDANGYVTPTNGVWLGEGAYSIAIQAPDGAGSYVTVETRDNVPGYTNLTGGTVEMVFVQTIAELQALSGGESDLVYVSGYYTLGGIGGGVFSWDGSSTADSDFGMVIAPSPEPASGRWLRSLGNRVLYPGYYGILESVSAVSPRFQNMISYASDNNFSIVIPPGNYDLSGDIDFSVPTVIQGGVQFGASLTTVLTFSTSDLTIEQTSPLIDKTGDVTLQVTGIHSVELKWWDVPNGIISDASAEIAEVLTNSGTADVIVRNRHNIGVDSTVDTGTHKLIFENGGSFNIDSGSLVVGDVVNNSGTPIFTGDWGDITYTNKSNDVYQMVNYFTSGDAIGSEYGTFQATATNSGAERVVLDWTGLDITWDNGPFIYDDAVHHLLYDGLHTISHSDTFFTSFTSFETDGACFAISGASPAPVIAVNVNPKWFGARPNERTFDNESALEQAIKTAAQNEAFVDLDGGKFYIFGTVNYDLTDAEIAAGKYIEIRNGGLLTTQSDFGNLNRYIAVTGDLRLDGVSLKPHSTYTGTLIDVDAHSSSVYELQGLTMRKCEVSTPAVMAAVESNFQKLDIRDCKINCSSLTFSNDHRAMRLIGNELGVDGSIYQDIFCTERSVVLNNRSSNVRFFIEGEYVLFQGNAHSGGDVSVTRFRGVNILSNYLEDSIIDIDGYIASTVVNGLQIRGNTLASTGASYTGITVGGNIAATGHTANIIENSGFGSVLIPSTVVTGVAVYNYSNASSPILDTNQDFTFTLNPSDYLLPFSSVPFRVQVTPGEHTYQLSITPPSGTVTNARVPKMAVYLSGDTGAGALPSINTKIDLGLEDGASITLTEEVSARFHYECVLSEVS